jgi:hypothetical protein
MINQFKLSLSETSRWCTSKACSQDPANSLRSGELAPDQGKDWQAVVKSVCERRAHLVGRNPACTAGGVTAGRMLIFDPGLTLSDGAAMVESSGFFDAGNTPAWDTWIAYVEEEPPRPESWTKLDSYLVCWIPAVFVALVDRAVAVNPERCLLWADETDTPFLRHLREQDALRPQFNCR